MRTQDSQGEEDASDFKRIERAYCVELGAVVTIDEARRTYLSESAMEQYHFECAEEMCRPLGVRIAGVNYRFDASEKAKFVSNHFRRLDDHHPACPYFARRSLEELKSARDSARLAKALHQDLIEEFVPPDRAAVPSRNAPVSDAVEAPCKTDPPRARKERRASTSSIARLVDTYRALVGSEIPNILREHRIRVRGVGPLPIGEYFTPVYRARPFARDQIVYGGARLAKTYGAGFKLRFFDRCRGQTAFLYVSAPIASGANAWTSQLHSLRDGGWCTAYALGHFSRRESVASLSLDVRSAEHLLLRSPTRAGPTTIQPGT